MEAEDEDDDIVELTTPVIPAKPSSPLIPPTRSNRIKVWSRQVMQTERMKMTT